MNFDIPVVILACRVFQNWLEHLLPDGLTDNITFFDYALLCGIAKMVYQPYPFCLRSHLYLAQVQVSVD